jgi:hypothetical protein
LLILGLIAPATYSYLFGSSAYTSFLRTPQVKLSVGRNPKPNCPIYMRENVGETAARWPLPPTELLEEALSNAKTLIRDSGGCIDSISFGIAWKSKFPSFSRERFHGTQISSFNKLLKVNICCSRIHCTFSSQKAL